MVAVFVVVVLVVVVVVAFVGLCDESRTAAWRTRAARWQVWRAELVAPALQRPLLSSSQTGKGEPVFLRCHWQPNELFIFTQTAGHSSA